MSLKFSLRTLLILIGVICIACAALANTGIWWHSIVVTATLTGMTGLLIWGTLHTGPRRAFACGWLLFAAGYLALVFGPWTGNHLGGKLISTKALAHLELKARGNNPSPPVLNSAGNTVADYNGDGSVDLDLVAPAHYSNTIWTSYPATSVSGNVFGRSGVTNYTTFQSTGHWLLATALGYAGGCLAAFLRMKRRA
jgi:hypothetical protein